MSYGTEIRTEFAKTYAHLGNATHALVIVLGGERSAKMQRHTLRARASELLNDYRTAELVEQAKAEMTARGEVLPHYRKRTWRADLYAEEQKDPLAKVEISNSKTLAIFAKLNRRATKHLLKSTQ